MSRILIRSGKDPFTPVSAEATVLQDVMNTNVGNYLFAHAVHRTLMVPGAEIISNSTLSETARATPEDCARVNEQFDAFVIPLANAFRPEFQQRLRHLTTLIQGLEIPVVVVGVGAQTGPDNDLEELTDIVPTVKAFVSAVLERSASIGVRGELTRKFLNGLGFADQCVEVIGCPSLFMHGRGHRLPEPTGDLNRDSKLSVNITPGIQRLAEIVRQNADHYPNLTFVAQDRADLNLMLWGEDPSSGAQPPAMTTGHQLYREDRMRFFLDAWTWFDYMASREFVFGSRFHGNVVALLARTPAVLLTHDSRTLELAEYHAMPHRRMRDVPRDIDAADLFAQCDVKPFNEAYEDRFAAYLGFLDRNRLTHIHAPGQANAEFDRRVAATTFPSPVKTLGTPDGREVAARLRWLRDGQLFDGGIHRGALVHPFPHPPRRDPATPQKEANANLQAKLTESQKELRRVARKLSRVEDRASDQRRRLDQQHRQITVLERRMSDNEASSHVSLIHRILRRLARPR